MESVWIMNESKVLRPSGTVLTDRVTVVVEKGRDTQQLAAGFTLRVKPDRRRVQLRIPAALDRRRSR